MKIANATLFNEKHIKPSWHIDRQFKPVDDVPINDKVYIDKSRKVDETIEAYSAIDADIKQLITLKEILKSLSRFVKELDVQGDELRDSFKIKLIDKLIFELPIQFQALYNSIEESKYILELQENWDDEGSPAYKESTWIRAIEFVCDYTITLYSKTKKIIDAPQIYHGPNGSIDILWKKENCKLLINIGENPEEPASFYGDDYKQQTIRGTFNPSKYNKGLLSVFLSLL